MTTRAETPLSSSTPLSLSTLPSVDPARLTLHNALHAARHPLEFDWHGRAASLKLLTQDRVDDESWKVTLWLGDEPLTLSASARAFDCLGQHPERRRGLDEVDRELAMMWLEVVWLEWLTPLESQLGVDIRLGPFSPSASECPLPLCFEFTLDDASHPVRLELATTTAEWLLPLFDRAFATQPSAAGGVMLPLRIEAGTQMLSLGDWRSLCPGDVVMLDAAAIGDVRLNLADRFAGHARLDETGLQPSEPLRSMAHRQALNSPHDAGDSRDSRVSNNNEDSQTVDRQTVDNQTSPAAREQGVDKTTPPDREPNDSSLNSQTANGLSVDDLPVRLTCELGRLEMSLGELRQLGNGSVLPLTRQPEQAVDLVVNGRRMGRGRLVAIGDAVGVQIERLALEEGHTGDD